MTATAALVYEGQRDGTGMLLRCDCGALATHLALRIAKRGALGAWDRHDHCEDCARAVALSPDPPPQDRTARRVRRASSAFVARATQAGRGRARSCAATVGHLR